MDNTSPPIMAEDTKDSKTEKEYSEYFIPENEKTKSFRFVVGLFQYLFTFVYLEERLSHCMRQRVKTKEIQTGASSVAGSTSLLFLLGQSLLGF